MPALLLMISMFLVMVLLPGSAEARKIAFGISDTGSARSFEREASRLGFRFPVVQTFHPWGNSLNQAIPRWKSIGVVPYLHISTADDESGEELITPWGISRGKGDGYLIELNHSLAEFDRLAVVRPMGEPNRGVNPYGAFYPDGSSRGARNSQAFYRASFRRIYLIVHGGKRKEINKRLRRLGMPPIRFGRRDLHRPEVRIAWSPLPSNLGIRGNGPGTYWPGGRFLDLVGTSFFSAWPFWGNLRRFYRKYAVAHDKPFVLAEWGLNHDAPGFVRQTIRWCIKHRRCRAMLLYRGFYDRFDLRNFPESSKTLRRELKRRPFFEFPVWVRGG